MEDAAEIHCTTQVTVTVLLTLPPLPSGLSLGPLDMVVGLTGGVLPRGHTRPAHNTPCQHNMTGNLRVRGADAVAAEDRVNELNDVASYVHAPWVIDVV
jgi:hypothetical protein